MAVNMLPQIRNHFVEIKTWLLKQKFEGQVLLNVFSAGEDGKPKHESFSITRPNENVEFIFCGDDTGIVLLNVVLLDTGEYEAVKSYDFTQKDILVDGAIRNDLSELLFEILVNQIAVEQYAFVVSNTKRIMAFLETTKMRELLRPYPDTRIVFDGKYLYLRFSPRDWSSRTCITATVISNIVVMSLGEYLKTTVPTGEKGDLDWLFEQVEDLSAMGWKEAIDKAQEK